MNSSYFSEKSFARAFLLRLILISVLLPLLASAAGSEGLSGVLTHSADPFIFRGSDNSYYLFTTNANNMQIPAYRSADMKQWALIGDAMPVLPSWARKGFTWAPEVIEAGGRYVIYYTARHRDYELPCIGSASSSRIEGPYTDDSDRPLVCQTEQGGSIDPSPFRDDNGRLYLLWKGNGNKVRIKTEIWIDELSADGRTLKGRAISLLKNDLPWEEINIEAPTLLKHDNKYYLFYSGAMFNTPRYSVGYAVSDNVMGPYTKSVDSPILKTGDGLLAPGHQGIFRDSSNGYWMVFHSYDGVIRKGNRSTRISRMEWRNGKPRVIPNTEP
jgi:beta-xylosidase